eukprot:COSAG02_NODE_153_length_33128_cov_10.471253_23_plen_99_part_00
MPQSAIDAELKAFDDKDLRLRSVGPDVRKREAKRRLMDIDVKAGQPGTNLCRFTGQATLGPPKKGNPLFSIFRGGWDLGVMTVAQRRRIWEDYKICSK